MKNLQKIRDERGWSQQRLADESKVPKRTIEDLERRAREGKPDGRVSKAIMIADALGCTLDELCR